MIKKNEGNKGTLLVFFIPYVISTVLLFFVTIQSNPSISILLDNSQSIFNMDSYKFSIFIGLVVILLNLLILFVTFSLIKFVTQFFLKEEFQRDKKMLITLLLSNSIASIVALFLLEFLSIDYKGLTIITSILEFLIFTILYKLNVPNKQEVFIVSVVKFILLITNFIFLWFI